MNRENNLILKGSSMKQSRALTREIAAVDGVEERKAQEKVDKVLEGKAA